MRAYDKSYLDDAMKNLGEAFDYAVNVCGINADAFFESFVSSGLARQFGNGNPKYLAGYSGTELVMEIMSDSCNEVTNCKKVPTYDRSPEYWSGWVLAYYQWFTAKSFSSIHEVIKMDEILSLYPTLHEASEDKFVDTVNTIAKNRRVTSNLQKHRKLCGFSQSELARKADVNLRTLQQYELRSKDINKASALSVASIARVLCCSVEDLLE